MKRFRKPEDIRTAVIGYGPSFHMGRHHFGEMRRVGMVPTAVADIDPARLPVTLTGHPWRSPHASRPWAQRRRPLLPQELGRKPKDGNE